MTGMETLQYEFVGQHRLPTFAPILVGVVASGNLEVLIEPASSDRCDFRIETSARGFGAIWQAVVHDFHERHGLAGATGDRGDGAADGAVEGGAVKHRHQRLHRQDQCNEHAQDGNRMRCLAADQIAEKLSPEQAGDHCAGKRRQWDGKKEVRVEKLPRHVEP